MYCVNLAHTLRKHHEGLVRLHWIEDGVRHLFLALADFLAGPHVCQSLANHSSAKYPMIEIRDVHMEAS